VKRYDFGSALSLFDKELYELSDMATAVRFEKNPSKNVSFIVDANINYTNICNSKCSFCAFYRDEKSSQSYTLSIDEILKKAESLQNAEVDTLLIQGGLNKKIKYEYYIDMISQLNKNFPSLFIHAFSPPEIDLMGKINDKTVEEVLSDLWQAGLRTIPGGGAEILTENVRKKIAPLKISSDRWLEIMKIAHKLGYRTTATMMFGHIETHEDIINHLLKLRAVQDETGGFTAFISWDFKPENTALYSHKKDVTAANYLKIVAISRIVLDNFDHIQASWSSQGKHIGQLALYFGADDLGSMLVEENVMRLAGHRKIASIKEIERLIKDAGFTPARRNPLYQFK